MKNIYLLLFLFCTHSISAAPVWQISKGQDKLFISGTIHMLADGDYPLPNAYNKAFAQADVIYFETDIDAMQSPAFSQKMLKRLTFQDGRTLSSALSAKTYQAISKYLGQRGVDIMQMHTFKPGFVYVTLTVMELQKLGMTAPGVDIWLNQQAAQHNKLRKALETPEQQLSFLESIGQHNPDRVLQYTLEDLKNLPDELPKLKTMWREGDLVGLDKLGVVPFKAQYPQVYEQLLTVRNKNWLQQIESMFGNQQTEMLAVGIMHLAGDDSVFRMLKDKGYTITQLN